MCFTRAFLVFQRAILARGALDDPYWPWSVVLDPIKQHVCYVRAEVVGVALNVRQQRVEVDQRRRLHLVESREILAFERVDQQEYVRIDVDVQLSALAGLVLLTQREVRRVVQYRALVDLIQFGERALMLVKDVPWVECKHRRVGLSLRRQPIKLIPI